MEQRFVRSVIEKWVVSARLTGGVVTFLAAAAASLPAAAQTHEGARLLAVAEAHRALTMGNDSIYVNPAGLALGSAYTLELSYLDDARGSDRRFNASIIDSQAGPLAGGIAYTYSIRRPDDVPTGEQRYEGHRFDLALASRVGETVGIGATARYMTYERKDGDTTIAGGYDEFTFDAGLQWRFSDNFALGLAAYNLTNSDRREMPISWGAGLGFQAEALSIEGDVRYNAQIGKAAYSLGAAYIVSNLVPLRGGITYDLASETFAVSAGLGFNVDKFGIDIGYRQRVTGDRVSEDDDHRIVGISLRGSFL